ncbi:MAG: FAD-binding oxidoreductase [Alphaproteobacteria bacterium]
MTTISPQSLDILMSEFGPDIVITDEDILAPMLREWRDKFFGKTAAALMPRSTEQVSKIVRIISENGGHLVTQGGNTGLVGGQIPRNGQEFILSTKRMNQVRKLEPANNSITVDAGMTLLDVQEAAAREDRLFPLSLASEGSCTIGGNLATNAGGTAVLRYGNMRDLCLGLEFVTADGAIHNGLSGLRKDNTGYDLRHLMIGSEGTLGIITAASLKLFSRPRDNQTIMMGLESPSMAVELLKHAQTIAQDQLSMFELIPQFGLDLVVQHIAGRRDPLDKKYPWYVLLQFDGGQEPGALHGLTETFLTTAFEANLIFDAAWAQNDTQAKEMKLIREDLSEAQKYAGGSIKHDISMPVQLIPQFMDDAAKIVENIAPGSHIVAFGHLGDGNLHYNVSQPDDMDKEDFLSRWVNMNEQIHDLVVSIGGSISAEHGIGVLKNAELLRFKSPHDIQMMRAIKQALDPNNIFNPDRILLEQIAAAS